MCWWQIANHLKSLSIEGSIPTNACTRVHVCRSKWLCCNAVQEVYLRNPLHSGGKTCKQGIHPGFETQNRCHQKSKVTVSVAPQKGHVFFKNLEKNCQKISTETCFRKMWKVQFLEAHSAYTQCHACILKALVRTSHLVQNSAKEKRQKSGLSAVQLPPQFENKETTRLLRSKNWS